MGSCARALENNRTESQGYKNVPRFDLREGDWQTQGTLSDVSVGGGLKISEGEGSFTCISRRVRKVDNCLAFR